MTFDPQYGAYNMHDRYNGEIFQADSLRPLYRVACERARLAIANNSHYHINIYRGCKLVAVVGTGLFGNNRRKLVICR